MGASSKHSRIIRGRIGPCPCFQAFTRQVHSYHGSLRPHPCPAMYHVIGHITVKDPAEWAEYRAQVPATLAPWQAELVFAANGWPFSAARMPIADTVVIRFPTPRRRRWLVPTLPATRRSFPSASPRPMST